MFLGLGGRNESNSHQLVPTSERKTFHELDLHHVQKVGIKRFWARVAQMSLTRHQLPRIGEKNLFHELDVHHVQKVGIKRFLGSGGQNESKSHQLARFGENKIFHEIDVHHVQKVGIKRFWVQEGEMSLTAIKSLDGEKKIFMNSTDIMFTKQESNVFRLIRPK